MAQAAALSPPDLRRAARRGLAIYFALVVVLSGAIEAYIIMNPELFGTLWVLALMWSPALASAASSTTCKNTKTICRTGSPTPGSMILNLVRSNACEMRPPIPKARPGVTTMSRQVTARKGTRELCKRTNG
jgi:hypothetical protein